MIIVQPQFTFILRHCLTFIAFSEMIQFTGNEGELVAASKFQELATPHKKKQKEIHGRGENFVEAEFFGIKKFNKLIEKHGDKCVGFRVFYGSREEDHSTDDIVLGKGKHTSRLIIVPVDAEGNNLIPAAEFGKKDAPGEDAMAGGPLCPTHCGK